MEAAAKTIQLLTQRILPEHPHHLSYFADWRYRHHPVDDRKRIEEWNHPRMQYLTLVSEADRGVLLTRSDYDMREEPPKPVPRGVSALASKPGEKKKLSFSDYKNKKSAGAVSTSPPEPSMQRKDNERSSNPPPAASSPAPAGSSHSARSSSEVRRGDPSRPRETDSPHDGKQSLPRSKPAVDMRLPPKPPPKSSLPPRPPSPENRKRFADNNDETRSQKRSRPDAGRPSDESSQSHRRDDDYRRRDRDLPPARDSISNRESKASSSSSLTNGRSVLKGPSSSSRTASPASRPRDDAANGARPSASASNRHTPTKADSKAFVPPLLSPLRLSFDKQDQSESASREKEAKKKREDGAETMRQPKPKRLDPPSTTTKRQRSPMRLPALLSPTLPPEIEAELKRMKKTPPTTASDIKIKEETHVQPTAKKGPFKDSEESQGGKTLPKRRLIVVLRIPKRLRQSVRRILTMSPRKEAESQESISESPQLSQARKRPVGSIEAPISDSIAVKRPRTSELTSSARLTAPATPSKKGSASMSRVSSTNSMAHTPGELPNTTPSAGGSVDRVYNGLDPHKGDKAEINALREREARLSQLGRQLKHKADLVMNRRHASNSANGTVEAIPRVRFVLGLESIIAFMSGFQAQNKHRSLCNKTSEPTSWESLFPLMEFHQKEMRRLDKDRFRPLIALLILLQTFAVDELIKCYFTYENPGTHINVEALIKHERSRARGWVQIRESHARISNPGLRADSITPWSTIDEVAETGLRILRRWCAEEKVDWTPEVNLREGGGR